MRNVFFILLLLSLSGCGTQQQKANANEAATAAPSPLTFGTPYDQLLAKFTEINFDTLMIRAPDLTESDFTFKGIELDSTMVELLPEEVSRRDKSFAVARFALDTATTALIARVPGEYDINQIILLVFSHVQKKLSYKADLAFSWGDAGYAAEKTSWLIRTKEKTLNQLAEVYNWSETDTDKPEDTVTTTTNDYSLIHITPYKTDTLSKDSTSLLQTYGYLLKKPE